MRQSASIHLQWSGLWRAPALSVLAGFALCGCEGRGVESILVTGSSTVAPMMADAAKRYEDRHPGIRIDVQSGGSSRGIADVRSGLADFGMISRDLKAGESGLKAHSLALDGVGVITHRDNPIAGLDRDQLKAIYTKGITKWSEFGGEDAPIVVVSKADGRATFEVFLKYLELDAADIEADIIVGENQHAIQTVAGNRRAIGYVSIGEAASEKESGTGIRLLACDGVAATVDEVARGEFPISRPLQIVTDNPLSPAAQAFLDYLKSEEIHDLIEAHLYVPLAR